VRPTLADFAVLAAEAGFAVWMIAEGFNEDAALISF
jgi:hypothetical protein